MHVVLLRQGSKLTLASAASFQIIGMATVVDDAGLCGVCRPWRCACRSGGRSVCGLVLDAGRWVWFVEKVGMGKMGTRSR